MPVSLVLGAVLLSACSPARDKKLRTEAAGVLGILPAKMPGAEKDTAERIALGEKLYFDQRLSKNDSQSCNSCHNVKERAGGVDNQPTSTGAFGKKGGRNSPTVLNAGFHLAQFWDGRAPDLQAQAKGPILNPVEMAMPDEKSVLEKLQKTEYPELFKKAFPDAEKPLTYDNLAEAIAAFERTLVTPSRFDDYLAGQDNALSEAEKAGLETFMKSGCTACHSGPIIGGTSYKKMGLVKPYDTKDLGRFEVTRKEEDRFVFKVPSLRNIALTAPYFHDGKSATLEDAVARMGVHQLGKELTQEEVSSITTFLKSLTDKNRESK